MSHSSYMTFAEVADEINQAWLQGRPIVPLIGAGASAAAGIPTIATLVRYIAKLHYMTQHGLFLPPGANASTKSFWNKTYATSIADFLDDHGWPDRFALTADLALALARRSQSNSVEEAIRQSKDALCADLNRSAAATFKQLRESLAPAIAGESRETKLCIDTMMIELQDEALLDWRPLIRLITSHRRELADALFTQLHINRAPSLFHFYLAHLSRLFGIRTIFTFNFDPLIEHALAAQGMSHQIFAMEHGDSLPASVLASHLAVIKMHGSTHNLLMDERLDYPIDEAYKTRFVELVGRNPLLVVIGCSGHDRRCRDLVTLVDALSVREGHEDTVSCIWMQYLSAQRYAQQDRSVAHLKTLRFSQLRDAGSFLSNIYTHITSRLPSSRTPYSVLVRRSWPAAANPSTRALYEARNLADGGFPPKALVIDASYDTPDVPHVNAYSHVLKYICDLPSGYYVLHIDLEEHHTLGGVVSDILSQAREADSSLTPLRLRVCDDNSAGPRIDIRAAVRRVMQVLRRTRTALIFDGLDAFHWRATTHHGYTSFATEPPARDELRDVCQFLETLLSVHFKHFRDGESVICITTDELTARHPNDPDEKNVREGRSNIVKESLAKIKAAGTVKVIRTDPVTKLLGPHNFVDTAIAFSDFVNETPCLDMYIKLLCTARRTRSLTMLQHMYRDVFVNSDGTRHNTSISALIDDLTEHKRLLIPLEGGAYSIERPVRNALYTKATEGTSVRHIASLLINPGMPFDRHTQRDTIAHIVDAVACHDYLARYYYGYEFLPSGDPSCLFEYLYHRMSGLRYLTDCILLMAHTPDRWRDLLAYLLKDDGNPLRNRHVYQCYYRTIREAKTDYTKLTEGLINLRTSHLNGVRKSWQRTDSALRDRVSPDLLLAWCDTITEYDLGRNIRFKERWEILQAKLVPKPDVNSSSAGASPAPVRPELPALVAPLEDEACDSLRDVVSGTAIRCLYERGDFRTLELRILASLRGAVQRPDATQSFAQYISELHQRREQDSGKKEIASVVHPLLTVTEAIQWGAFSRGASKTGEEGVFTKELDSLISGIVQSSRDAEAQWRWEYSSIERGLMYCAPVGEAIRPRKAAPNVLRELLERVETCQDRIQDESDEPVRAMQNPLLNPTVDRTLLVPYRALFRVLAGRIRALQARDQSPLSENLFPLAYREFELARGSIGSANRALLVLCEVCAADTANEHADWLLRNRMDNDFSRLSSRMHAKVRSARSYLNIAKETMRIAGRHVMLWRFVAIVSIRTCVLHIIADAGACRCSTSPSTTVNRTPELDRVGARRLGALIRILREGLQSIRDGLDYTPADASGFVAEYFDLWHQLLYNGIVCAISIAKASHWDIDIGAIVLECREWWGKLNDEADLNVGEYQYWIAELERTAEAGGRLFGSIELSQVREDPFEVVSLIRKTFEDSRGLEAWWSGVQKDWQP